MREIADFKVPEKDSWLLQWNEEDARCIARDATILRVQGAMNDLAAWRAAEHRYQRKVDPLLRRQT